MGGFRWLQAHNSANRLQLVINDLIGPEQNYTVKRRSIQDDLHLVYEVLGGIEDGTEAALNNLDQSKAFERLDHRFLATVLQMDQQSKPRLAGGGASEQKALRDFRGREVCLPGLPLSPLLYVLAWKAPAPFA